HAQLGRQRRVVVRERLVAGDTDQEILDYLVARYGEFVLLRPNARGANLLLWLSAPAMLLIGCGVGWSVIRRRTVTADTGLTEAEQAELDKILRS
ncbi:MAG: cytochrome c-type biogenesis protein, partial [Pseudomonadota bacterium]